MSKKQKIIIAGIVLLVIFYIASKSLIINMNTTGFSSDSYVANQGGTAMERPSMGVSSKMSIMPPVTQDYAPAPDIKSRMVIQDSSLSLQVQNVETSINQILLYTKNQGGYMVNQSTSRSNEAPSGTLIVRIPQDKLTGALEYFKRLSIQVVSENLTGDDVTDQYVDTDARLATLMATKQKFETILSQAKEVSDILNVQRELINLQGEIDAVKGQQQYLEKSSQMAKITIYLSTDDLALPYAPDNSWRASVIFRQAVRSLILEVRSIASWLIYAAVYGVLWIPLLIVAVIVAKRLRSWNK